MLTIICGEDVVSARDYYTVLKNRYKEKGYEIRDIPASAIQDVQKWLSDSPSLFSLQMAFFTSGLNKKISKRNAPTLYTLVENLAKRKDVEIIDWEDFTTSRELKISKGIIVKEFKLSQSIFKLLDACYPGNLQNFIRILHGLPHKVDDIFVFIMLSRHIRNLLGVKTGHPSKSLASWQVARLRNQTAYWKPESLMAFYDGLFRIDLAVKTSRNPYSVKESLDTLACYFL